MSRTHLIIMTAALLAAPVGCGNEPGRGAPGAGPAGPEVKRPRIALIMKSLANEFFATMEEGARKHQAANPERYELIANGIKDERDLARQVAIVDEMIAQQVDAIALAPADSKALVSACKKARDAGIVVVNIDNKLDEEVLESRGLDIPFVGPDNRAGARMVGEFLASKLKRGDEVAIIEGIRTAFNSQQRRQGFEDACKSAGLTIVDSQSAQWEMDQANRIASAMLSERPRLKALLCCNDSMALGALAAVKAAGRVGQVQIVGFDNITAIQSAIKDGSVLATADQHGDQIAAFGIEHALKILQGQPAEDLSTPVDLVTAEQLK